MARKKHLLFVINPIAGGREKSSLHHVIRRNLDHSLFDYEFAWTESEDHARRLSFSAIRLGFDIVAAVGGDGTVNEVARGILERTGQQDVQEPHGQATLAIVPSGSGNGLARHLGIPVNPRAAIRVINNLRSTRMDVGLMNDDPFFCVAGTGFDAHISHIFATGRNRGFPAYIGSALREIRRYRPGNYVIKAGDKTIRERAFLVSIANASQYGNNAYIAPGASVSDGVLDLCLLRPFPLYRYPEMAVRLMTGTIAGSRFMRRLRGTEFRVIREDEGPVHLDGEPAVMGRQLDIRVMPSSLRVIMPLKENTV